MPSSLKIFAYIVATFFLISSCENSAGNNDEFTFPLQVGNYWHYKRNFQISNVRPDSLKEEFEEVYQSEIDADITRNVTLSNGKQGVEYFSVENDSLNIYTSFNFYANRADGMYLLGYRGSGSMAQPKAESEYRFRINGLSFSNIPAMLSFLKNSVPFAIQKPDSIYLEDPEPLILSYPLKFPASWTFRSNGNPFRIDKEVIGEETIQTVAGDFSCYSILWKYDLDNDGNWDENISILDHIGAEGLIKRELTITDMVASDEFGHFLFYSNASDVTILTEFGQR